MHLTDYQQDQNKSIRYFKLSRRFAPNITLLSLPRSAIHTHKAWGSLLTVHILFNWICFFNIDNNGVYSKGYGIVNLGLGPYGGKQELITLKKFGQCLKQPNIVLYLGCSNDYTDDLLFDSGIRHKNLVLHNPHYGWFYYPMKWFLLDLEIGKRIKYQVQEGIFKTRAYKAQAKENSGRSIAEMEKEAIEKIVSTAIQMDALPVVSWFMVGDSYDWLKSWATQNNVRFADWEPTARSITQAVPGIPWGNQHSGAHHRAWLNFVIARAFAQEIRASGTTRNARPIKAQK